MKPPVVVLTSATFAQTRDYLMPHARLICNDAVEPWPYDEVVRRCRQADAMMAFMTDRIDSDFLDRCPRLKVVGAALKGFDNIDVETATARGVWITIVPDLLTIPTAELAIGLMLGVGRHIVRGDSQIRTHGFSGWRPQLYGSGLDGSTVGLVGYGKVGQAIAQRLGGFGCRLLAYDESDEALRPTRDPGVAAACLDDILQLSDFVVLALPLTARTTHLIDSTTIARIKRGAYLINPARGSLVDEGAVADAIERGHLAGYAADVFECEDWARKDHPVTIEPRLAAIGAPTLLTPHIGSAVTEVRRMIELSAARSIVEALQGRRPIHAINRPHP